MFPIQYADEVGHLGHQDRRKSATVDNARLFRETYDTIRVEGRDDAGRPWRAWVPYGAEVASTEVWTGDFDGNGRQDLLIAADTPGNGRCIAWGILTFLLFDRSGRPVPWTAETQMPERIGDERSRPAILLDTNANGRAELVTTGCEYAEPPPHWGEDRLITGIYEAVDTHFVPVCRSDLSSYLRAVKRTQAKPPFVRWVRPKSAAWPDQQAETNIRPVTILRIGENSSGPWVLYSDGKRRHGLPLVVLDRLDGRDIHAVVNRDILFQLRDRKWRARLLGSDSEPTWLWVDQIAKQ